MKDRHTEFSDYDSENLQSIFINEPEFIEEQVVAEENESFFKGKLKKIQKEK